MVTQKLGSFTFIVCNIYITRTHTQTCAHKIFLISEAQVYVNLYKYNP